jgi:integrase
LEEYNPETMLGEGYLSLGARQAIEASPSIRKLALSIVGRRRRGSSHTVAAYIQGIESLSDYLGLKPEEVLQQAREGRIDLLKRINSEGDGWIDTSLNSGQANKTITTRIAALKRWLEVNDIQLDWAKVTIPTSAIVKNRDRAPTPAELTNLLSFCDVKETAMISLLATSGLRIGTMLSLRWRELDFNFKPDVVKITIGRELGRKFGDYRETNGELESYTTFCSTKTREALINYRKSLEVSGHSDRDQYIVDPEDYVFSAPESPRQLQHPSSFRWRWYRLCKRAGLVKKSTNRYEIRVHSLRKYFRSRASGLDPSTRENMMGHRGAYLDAAYLRLTEQDLYDAYVQVMPRLEVEVGEAEQEVNQLKKRIRDLEAQQEADKQSREVINNLVKTVAELRVEMATLQPRPKK